MNFALDKTTVQTHTIAEPVREIVVKSGTPNSIQARTLLVMWRQRSARPLADSGLKFSTAHADGLSNATDAIYEIRANWGRVVRADERRGARRSRRLRSAGGLLLPMTASDGAQRPDLGPKLAAISTLTVRLFGQYTGRGPSKARTFIDEDVVIVVLQDMLTTAELTLVDNDRHEIVLATRKIFQEAMSAELIAGIEQILQRTVSAFLSANHIDPDIAIGAFVLTSSED